MSNRGNRIRKQKAAEADVAGYREELGPFVVAAETTRMPMVFTNARAPDNPIIFLNQAFLSMTGFDEDEVLGQDFASLMERGTDPEALAEIKTAFEGGRDLQTQVRCRRKDGSVFWVTIFVNPVRDDHGRTVQHFASFVDIARDKEEESRLRALLGGLESRAQATLTAVQAIAVQMLQRAAGQQGVDEFQRRVLALDMANGAPDTGTQRRHHFGSIPGRTPSL